MKRGVTPTDHTLVGNDSQAIPENVREGAAFERTVKLMTGSVLLVQPEPIWEQTKVTIDLTRGGKLTSVGWPGPNVEANIAGLPIGPAIGIHGLYESPLPGQEVLLGFVEGSSGNPIVIQKYPYGYSKRPDRVFAHILPMTEKAIGPTDVVLGHHTGSFIAFRGTLPLPAEIDIVCLTVMTVSVLGIRTEEIGGASDTTIGGAYDLTVGAAASILIGGSYDLTVGAAASITTTGLFDITAGAALDLTGATIGLTSAAGLTISASGPVTVTAAPSIIVNGGALPVARMGDLTPTFIGPQPIIATGTSILV